MKPIKFTTAELNQLLFYCQRREETGWYYAPKEHFEKRHKSIIKKLNLLFKNQE